MNAFEIIRAWKDEAFRASLTAAQLAALPANPAGLIELADVQLDLVAGGANAVITRQWGCENRPTNKCTRFCGTKR